MPLLPAGKDESKETSSFSVKINIVKSSIDWYYLIEIGNPVVDVV